jgi:Tol biopolymer transport system component
VQGLPSRGGADLIALLNTNDIWVMGVDGSNPTRITNDGGMKNDLQWSPDGQSLYYLSSMCIWNVTYPGGEATQITCFNSSQYLEAFEISPDGKQVAISLDRVLFVVPFDIPLISKAGTWLQLRDMQGCFTYGKLPNQAPPKAVRWSNDGNRIAVNTLSVEGGQRVDLVRIFDVSNCNSSAPQERGSFPGSRFTMTGFSANPVIPSFDWDGKTLFVLNSKYRYELGYLYAYNTETLQGKPLDPLKTSCCYSTARFSPDGNFLFFAYQNLNDGQNAKTQLYYISYGTIGSGANNNPLLLPDGFFTNPSDHLDATLRPVSP